MKKSYLLFAAAAMSLVACNKVETITPLHNGEMSVVPVNAGAGIGTKGYVEGSQFVETYYNAIHSSSKEGKQALRTMQISSYLTPQNGEAGNYFVDKTYSAKSNELTETVWWNTNTVGGDHDPIYWPVGGTLDFLAYSLSAEASGAGSSQNVKVTWDSENASSKVVMEVPGENSQNDILYASAHGIKSSTGASSVPMQFNHAQAWIEFALTGSKDDVHTDGIVTLKRIELEKVYNAGTLTVTNNLGTPVAKWDFSGELNQNIEVDNLANVTKLNGTAQYLDMLIPEQTKTAFVIYYTLGNDPQELSYRFTTDLKTWTMGEKYIYNINITTSEVTVAPKVTEWNAVKEYSYTVKTPATTVKSGDATVGTVTVDFLPSEESFEIQGEKAGDGSATYTCDTWSAQITLTAKHEGDAVFVKWSDDVTENPRTFAINGNVDLPEAIFGYEVTTTTFEEESIRCTSTTSKVVAGEPATIKAVPADGYKFYKWFTDNTCEEYMSDGTSGAIIVSGDEITIDSVNEKMTFYAHFLPEDVSGLFTVDASGKTVKFAKGNLFWNGKLFDVEDIQPAVPTSWDANHVGHLFWSKDASVAVAEDYVDYSCSVEDSFFAAGGGAITGYTVLSADQWSYLVTSRGERSFALSRVAGVNGVLLFPDGWTGSETTIAIENYNLPEATSPTSLVHYEFATNTLNSAELTTLESKGVVFLPVTGYRGDSGDFDGMDGDIVYWSSTADADNEENSYAIYFYENARDIDISNRLNGFGVRLVSE